MLVRLVDACNRRGRSAATGVRLSAQADVAVVVVQVGARDRTRARAVVAVRARGDELNTAENRGLRTDRRGDDVVREVDVLAHITENRLTRRGEETQDVVIGRAGVTERPGDKVVVRVNNGGGNGRKIGPQLIGGDRLETTCNGRHLFISFVEKKNIKKPVKNTGCLVEARNTRRYTRAAAVRLSAQADVAGVEVRARAGNRNTAVARAVVAVRALCDQLYLTHNAGLGANRRRDIRVRAVDVATHVSENRGTGGGEGTGCRSHDPGNSYVIRVYNRRHDVDNVNVELIGGDLRIRSVNGCHVFISLIKKKIK
jgi:hypothetical protein